MNTPALYSEIELSSEVTTASPHRLIQMLLDKCLLHVRTARAAIEEKNIDKKYYGINKAKDIVVYLRTCLDFESEQSKELAVILGEVYDSLEKSLVRAALHNNVDYLQFAEQALLNIKEGWDGIADQVK